MITPENLCCFDGSHNKIDCNAKSLCFYHEHTCEFLLQGRTPLHVACVNGHWPVVRYLVAIRDSVHSTDDKMPHTHDAWVNEMLSHAPAHSKQQLVSSCRRKQEKCHWIFGIASCIVGQQIVTVVPGCRAIHLSTLLSCRIKPKWSAVWWQMVLIQPVKPVR